MIATDLRSGVEQLGDMIAEASHHRSLYRRRHFDRMRHSRISARRAACGPVTGRSRSTNSCPARTRATRPGGGALRWRRPLPRPSPAAGIARWPRSTRPARSPAIITQNIDNLHQVVRLRRRACDRAARQHHLCPLHRLRRALMICRGSRRASRRPAARPTAPSATSRSRPRRSRSARRCRKTRCAAPPNWRSNATCSSRSDRRWWCGRRPVFR